MANLFFIHTPFQLMVAQLIIRQEGLNDNVMLMGYVDENRHFLAIYDLIVVDQMWSSRVLMPDVSHWAMFSNRHILKDWMNVYKNYRFIKRVINKYDIDTLFLGDQQNSSCQLTAMCFHKKGYKICFFEEGCSHYILYQHNVELRPFYYNKLYALLIDVIFYRPLFGVSFAYFCYWKAPSLSNIPMDVRYSIVPFYHESFDKQIIYQSIFSQKLKTLLAKEIISPNQDCILLLTSPFYSDGINNDVRPYIKTIVDFAKSLDNTVTLHIKFHPRETREVCDEILNQLINNKVRFSQLGNNGIPVEYYLQFVHYERIVMFLCSTSFYNGYLFPKTQFVSIMRDYYNNCKLFGLKNLNDLCRLIEICDKEW